MQRRERTSGRAVVATFSVSVALGVAAFWVMAQAFDVQSAWADDRATNFRSRILPWVGWLALFALAGFLAAVALRTPRSLRYRPWRPLLGSLAPVLMIAHGMAWLNGWVMPGFLRFGYFHVSLSVQAILAIFIGVAVASGFEDVGSPPRHRSEETASGLAPRAPERQRVMSSGRRP